MATLKASLSSSGGISGHIGGTGSVGVKFARRGERGYSAYEVPSKTATLAQRPNL